MGNVYMEADQVRFKDSTYRNVQEGLAAALEGGGGGGTTVVANPEGSATADLAKLQVGTTIYGIPAEAGDISYDNTSSGLTADDVQEAIDELNTGLSGVTELIPSGATPSNKLATESDIPDAVTGNPSGSATAGNLTKLQIGSDIYSVPGEDTYSTTETVIGKWGTQPLYRKMFDFGALPNATTKNLQTGLSGITPRLVGGTVYIAGTVSYLLSIPYSLPDNEVAIYALWSQSSAEISIVTTTDRSSQAATVWLDYTKDSENP